MKKKKKHNSLFRETQKHNSLSKEKKKKYILFATTISKETQHVFYISSSSLFRAHHAAPSLHKLFSWVQQALNSSFVLRR